VRILRRRLSVFAVVVSWLVCCAHGCAQEPADQTETIPVTISGPGEQTSDADLPATVDGSMVIARINGQVVQACELLWMVNLMIEKNRDKIPPEKLNEVRGLLMKKQLSGIVDRKLLYDAFRRNVPAENIPHIEENLADPFEKQEIPLLMKQFNVGSQGELERKLCEMGSSLNDTKRAFNERVIASEWMRNKIKVNEEISPIEIHDYYVTHPTEYDYPTKVRWEELMVRKSRYASGQEAYAAACAIGNDAWTVCRTIQDPKQPAFAEIAKAKSDGVTKDKGGQYDWTSEGSLALKPLNDALFSLPVGRMSTIIDTPVSFHIVRVLERKEAGRTPFTEVQVKIRDKLKDDRLHTAQDKYLQELRSEASIETIFTGKISADALAGRMADGTVKR
jgi:hypothetical protein